jgi:hypothetical protein
MRKALFMSMLLASGSFLTPAFAYESEGEHYAPPSANVANANANSQSNSSAKANSGVSKVYNNHDLRTKSSATSSSDNANNAVQSQNVNFAAQSRDPVNTAYAAPLVAGEDTCMGSSSIGGQGVGFGISIGTSWTDENCQRLKNSRQLASLGYQKAAVMLLCINDDVAMAMEAAGTPCRAKQEEASLQDQPKTAYVTSLFEGPQQAQLAAPAPAQVPAETVAEAPAPYTVAMNPVADVPSKKLRLRQRR